VPRASRLLFAIGLLAGCGRATELEPCNIASRECQADVYYAIIRLRGDGYDPFDGLPPIRTITVEQYLADLMADQPAPAPAPAEPEEPPAEPPINPRDVALQWLGLIRPATTMRQAEIENDVNVVAAFYDSSAQRVTVIDRGQDRNDFGDTVLLAHELVHAFQDDEVDLAPFDETNDGQFAARARIEGEAKLYEGLVKAELQRIAPEQLGLRERYAAEIATKRGNMPASRSPYYDVSWFAYQLGADMLVRGYFEGGNAAVRSVTADPPRGAVEYLARFTDAPYRAAPAFDCRERAPESFARVESNRFGAMQLYGFLTAARLPEPEAWSLAREWRDDRLSIYFDADVEQVLLTWRIRLATPAQAERVAEIARTRPELRAAAEGNDVLITGGELPAGWPSADDCAQ
jgi:hypothetical protein